ncbi:MAG: mannose-1-phosphate guanylyltransferase [Planctomycetota bacterium]|jgi:mannose-1-phosphate guanylyltransferase
MAEDAPKNRVAVIMAGGAGTRFWPVSTAGRPKQFLRLFGDRSLLRMSFDRVTGLFPPDRILVLTHRDFVPFVTEQIPQLPPGNVIGEPLRRDTAAAVALAALLCRRRFGDPVMAILTADHLIEPEDLFHRTLTSAARAARAGRALYTFGVPPTRPATSYGYLERGESLLDDEGIAHFRLVRFREKPDAATARSFFEAGRFLWNSGMFVWTAESILGELSRQLPAHIRQLEPALDHDGKAGWAEALERAFEPLEPTSIDFGVMENAAEVRCVAAPFAWEDVGGWLALEAHLEEGDESNRIRGRVVALDARSNIVFSEDPGESVALLGVKDLIVVRTGQWTLVAAKEEAERIKDLVRKIEKAERSDKEG